MEKRILTLRLLRALRQPLVNSVLVCLIGPPLFAQEIRIKVLNAHNGKPVTNECLNVSLGAWHGADLLAATNSEGVVVLHLEGNEARAEAVSSRTCGRTAVVGPKYLPEVPEKIALMGDDYVACQEYGQIVPGKPVGPNFQELVPTYSINGILESGVSAANTCGKIRVRAKPGELVLFVRPRSFLEKLRM